MKSGFVVSDLHLFRKFSYAPKIVPEILGIAKSAQALVLNGDIFDFTWTELAGVTETIELAVKWLEKFCVQIPSCKVFYVMGNHDGIQLLADLIESRKTTTLQNLSCCPAYARIEDSLFFHGDIPIFRPDLDPFERKLKEKIKKRKGLAGILHVLGMRIKVHRLAKWLFPPERCAEMILRSLNKFHPAETKEINRIFFGHTHNYFSDFLFQGKSFSNSGATLHGLHYRIQSFPAGFIHKRRK